MVEAWVGSIEVRIGSDGMQAFLCSRQVDSAGRIPLWANMVKQNRNNDKKQKNLKRPPPQKKITGVPAAAPPGAEMQPRCDRWGRKWDTGRGSTGFSGQVGLEMGHRERLEDGWAGIPGQVGRKVGHRARLEGVCEGFGAA